MPDNPSFSHRNPDDFLPAMRDERRNNAPSRPPSTPFRDGMGRLRKDRAAVLGFYVFAAAAVVSIALPFLLSHFSDALLPDTLPSDAIPPDTIAIPPDTIPLNARPSDILLSVLLGTRATLAAGLLASLLALILGAAAGGIAGFRSGKADRFLMGLAACIRALPDMLLAVPLALLLNAVLSPVLAGTALESMGSGGVSFLLAYASLYWAAPAQRIRGEIASRRHGDYALASRAAGAGGGWILRKHILPGCVGAAVRALFLQLPHAICVESFLAFLGLGVSGPVPSLGSLASDALGSLPAQPLRLTVPAAALALLILSLRLFGNELRNAFDLNRQGE